MQTGPPGPGLVPRRPLRLISIPLRGNRDHRDYRHRADHIRTAYAHLAAQPAAGDDCHLEGHRHPDVRRAVLHRPEDLGPRGRLRRGDRLPAARPLLEIAEAYDVPVTEFTAGGGTTTYSVVVPVDGVDVRIWTSNPADAPTAVER